MGVKFPSNQKFIFFEMREVELTVKQSANLVIVDCIIFGEKSRITAKKTS